MSLNEFSQTEHNQHSDQETELQQHLGAPPTAPPSLYIQLPLWLLMLLLPELVINVAVYDALFRICFLFFNMIFARSIHVVGFSCESFILIDVYHPDVWKDLFITIYLSALPLTDTWVFAVLSHHDECCCTFSSTCFSVIVDLGVEV